MQFKRILNSNSIEFNEAFAIYERSFPIFEQRSRADQVAVLCHENYFFQAVQNSASETLGLVCTWETDDFVYVEHLAVLESARDKKIGTTILEMLKSSSSLPIILEIDPPIDAISIRRRGFYERLGFVMNDYEHMHPPFKKNEQYYPLKILSYPEKIGQNIYDSYFALLVKTIMHYSEFKETNTR